MLRIRTLRIGVRRIGVRRIRACRTALRTGALSTWPGLSRPHRPGCWPPGPVRRGGRGCRKVFVAALVFLVFLHRLAGPLACLRDSPRPVVGPGRVSGPARPRAKTAPYVSPNHGFM